MNQTYPPKTRAFSDALRARRLIISDLIGAKKDALSEIVRRKPSIVRDFYLREVNETNDNPFLDNYYTKVLETVIASDSVREQKATISYVGLIDDEKYIDGAVFFGFINDITKQNSECGQSDEMQHYREVDSSLDGSLIHQSRVLSGITDQKYPLSEHILRTEVRAALGELNLLTSGGEQIDIRKLGDSCGRGLKYSTVTNFKPTIKAIKSKVWYGFGVDIFVALQLLIEPGRKIQAHELKVIQKACELFYCSSVFDKLLFLRSISGDSNARDFQALQTGQPELAMNFHAEAAYEAIRKRTLDDHVLDRSIQALVLITDLAERKQSSDVLTKLIILYERDPEALHFLNWDLLAALFKNESDYDEVEIAALNLYFSRFATFANHAEAYFQRGSSSRRGSARFINAVDDAIRSRFVHFDARISQFLRRVARLPRRTARLFAAELLNRSTLKLIPYLAANNLDFEDERVKIGINKVTRKTRIDRFISNIRYRFAEFFFDRKLIDQSTLRKVSDEEVEFIKLLYFYEQDSVGRIRGNWPEFRKKLVASYGQRSNSLASRLVQSDVRDIPRAIVDRLTHSVCSEIAQWILYRAPYSLDWCLSNYIRHGQFLSAFDGSLNGAIKALATFRTGNKPGLDDLTIDELICLAFQRPEHLNAFAQFRDDYYEHLADFRDVWLRVDEGAAIEQNLIGSIRSPVFYLISRQSMSVEAINSFASDVSKACENEFERFLSLVRNELRGEFFSKLKSLSEWLRVQLGENSEGDFALLFDTLERNWDEQIDNVLGWLNVSSSTIVVEDFGIANLARYIMNTLFANSISQEHLTVSSRFVGGKYRNLSRQIMGQYFDFFLELLHNTIINAFVHSGLGEETIASLQFSFEEQGFRLLVVTNVSKEKAEFNFQRHRKLVDIAASPIILEEAIEGGSGIARVKKVTMDTFGVVPDIAIPKLHPSKREFRIEYAFPVDADLIARRQELA